MQKNDENNFELSENKHKVLSKTKLRESLLYNTLKILVQTKSADIVNWKIKHVENINQQVFYIDLDKPRYKNLIKNHIFNESHLTIHKYYREKIKEGINGLTIAHYTETYLDPSQKQEVVIHVYFDRYGYYHHAQIKQYKGSRRINAEFEELPLDSHLEELLLTNIQQAKTILKNILDKNEDLRDSLIAKTDELEKQLQVISKQLEIDSIQSYIKIGKDFIETIELLNKHLDGYHDKRGEVIAGHLQFLEENSQKHTHDVQVTSAVSEFRNTNFPENKNITNSADSERNNSVYLELTKLDTELRTLKKALQKSPNEIKLLIKKDELVKNIQLKLLQHSSVLSTAKGSLKNILTNLQNFLKSNQTLLEIFEKEFWDGNIDVVQQIYPIVEHEITPGYIMREILLKLVRTNPRDKNHGTKLKAVFDFLNETSSIYRIFISSRGTLLFKIPNVDMYYSLLVAACQVDNLFAFKLLLEHGISPNNMGVWINNIQVPALYLIVSNSEPEKLIYLEEALKFGGHYLCEIESLSLDKKLMKTINPPNINSQLFASINKKINLKDYQTFYASLLECKNVVEWCSKIGNTQAIQLFLPQLKLEDILQSLANQTIKSSLSRRHIIPSPEMGCYTTNNKKNLNMMCADLLTMECNQKLVTIIFYPNENSAPIKLVEKLLILLKEKIAYYSQAAPNELENLFNKLYSRAKNLRFFAPKSLTSVWEFDACLLLLLLKPNPTIMTIQTLMQLYCYQASCVKNNYKENNQRFIEFYCLAMTLGTNTQFKEQLMATPVFDHILKMLGQSFLTNKAAQDLPDDNNNEDAIITKKL